MAWSSDGPEAGVLAAVVVAEVEVVVGVMVVVVVDGAVV